VAGRGGGIMRRRLKIRLHPGDAIFNKACAEAAEAFREHRFRDALAVYERFKEEHPGIRSDDIRLKIDALRSYIVDHVEKMEGPTAATPG